MVDPRDTFISRIDLARTRVRAFEGFVFLCGGPRTNDLLPIRSVRHMLYNELTSGRHGDIATRLRLAEDIQDWYRDGNYPDLLTFEEHLAGLSAVIVLIVESPGAVAELGAFSMRSMFVERLLVLVAELHYEAESFIRLGPLKRIENYSDQSVLVYDWHERSYSGTAVERFEKITGQMSEIVLAIKNFTSPDKSERNFKDEEPSHVMFLICEICDLFGALSVKEIARYLSELDISLDDVALRRYLFLLSKCELLRLKALGHGRYYYAPEWCPRVSFGFTPGEQINRDRVRVDVAAYYEREVRSRYEVLRRIEGQ